jgi:hypothetical protein
LNRALPGGGSGSEIRRHVDRCADALQRALG